MRIFYPVLKVSLHKASKGLLKKLDSTCNGVNGDFTIKFIAQKTKTGWKLHTPVSVSYNQMPTLFNEGPQLSPNEVKSIFESSTQFKDLIKNLDAHVSTPKVIVKGQNDRAPKVEFTIFSDEQKYRLLAFLIA